MPDSPLPDALESREFMIGLLSLLALLLLLGIFSHVAKGVVLTVLLQIFNVRGTPCLDTLCTARLLTQTAGIFALRRRLLSC